MKIKAIATICKKNSGIWLLSAKNGVQWVGDGAGMYPLYGMPPNLTEDNIFTIFDIPENKRGDYIFVEKETTDNINIWFEDITESDKVVEQGGMSIIWRGNELRAIKTSNGIKFIDVKYLAPVSDMETAELYERIGYNGAVGIIVKSGMCIVGVVMPKDIIDEDFVNEINEFGDEVRLAFQHKKRSYGQDNQRELIES